tara:strand:- start:538 stop:1302 length:765 start_codon:yes stop_codon:yes gene_type:complete
MSSTDSDSHFVFLDLSSRSPLIEDGTTMETFITNRIALKCDTVRINTAKNILAFPTPAIGIATGESLTIGLDMGMATKSVTLDGIITEQVIQKQFNAGDLTASKQDTSVSPTETYTGSKGNWVKAKLTAQEVCQLIHSYVDSSFMQSQQNLNRLLVFIPSRVGKDWLYHSGYGSGTAVENAPLIPFNYAVRDNGGMELDASGSIPLSKFPDIIDTSANTIEGMNGFIRSFDTTFVGGQPYVEFSISFEIAASSL